MTREGLFLKNSKDSGHYHSNWLSMMYPRLFLARNLLKGWLVLAFILRGLKEFGEPTRKALIMDLAPEGQKAAMFGLYYLLRDVIVSVAAFGGAFLWQIGPATNLLVAFSCGVAGTIGFAIWGKIPQETIFPSSFTAQ